MSLPAWVSIVHVLGGVLWLLLSILIGIIGLYLRLSRTTRGLRSFTRTLLYLGRGLIAPMALIVLATGLWLVLGSSEWKFSQPWVILGLLLFAMAAVGATHLTRLALRMQQAANGAAGAGLLRPWLLGQVVLVAILLAAFVDMGVKPGA